MVDIHTHLIPNVDDGSKNVETTFKAFKEAEKVGFTDIILTSHYIPEYNETKKEELTFWKENLQEVLKSKSSELKLHSGMEVYISENVNELIEQEKLLTLANSKYILMELPMNATVNYLDYVIYFLESIGLKLIIAHPERYTNVQKKPELVKEYIEKGCLMQCNYGSLLGKYGKEPKDTIKYLLKNNLVHFIATDCHNSEKIYLEVPKALKKLEKMIGTKKTYEITTLNERKIINNEQW